VQRETRAIARQIRRDVHHNGNLPNADGVFPCAATARAATRSITRISTQPPAFTQIFRKLLGHARAG
jgi:hypothetical protein